MVDVSWSCCSSGFLVFSFSVSTSEESEVVQPETNNAKAMNTDERRTGAVCHVGLESCSAHYSTQMGSDRSMVARLDRGQQACIGESPS